jgi:hypothetical protein
MQFAQNTLDAGVNATVLAGSYLRYDLQADMPGALLVKTADESRTSNATLTNDNTLTFATVATKKYLCELQFQISSSGANPGLKKQVKDTGVSTSRGQISQNRTSALGAAAGTSRHGSCFDTALIQTPTLENDAGSGFSWLAGAGWEQAWSHVMGGSNSNLTVEYAQSTSSATATTARSPSWLWYEEVP